MINFMSLEPFSLFGTEVDVDRHAMEIPHLPQPILNETLVGVAYVLGQVAEEDELGITCGELGNVFDFNPFAFYRWGRILLLDNRKQLFVEFAGRDMAAASLVDLLGGFQHLEDTLLVEYAGEDDGHILER